MSGIATGPLPHLFQAGVTAGALAMGLYLNLHHGEKDGEIPTEVKSDDHKDFRNSPHSRASGDWFKRDGNNKDHDPESWDDAGKNGNLWITIWFFKYLALVLFLCSSLLSVVVYRFVCANVASEEKVTKFKNAVGWVVNLPVQLLGAGGFCFFLHAIMLQWQNSDWASDQTGGRVIGMIFAAVVLIAFLGVTFVLEKGPKTAEFRSK